MRRNSTFLYVILSYAMLAGCGGSQPPIGAPGVMPQSRAIAMHAAGGGSWMLPEAKKYAAVRLGTKLEPHS